jgi:hypothetical protein
MPLDDHGQVPRLIELVASRSEVVTTENKTSAGDPMAPKNLRWTRAMLLALAFASIAAARPRVRIHNARGVGVHSVGETMFAEVEGRTWFFKKDGPSQVLHHGNFEGEALACRILTRLGFPVPQSRLVTVEGEEGAWFQTELVDSAFTGDVGIQSLYKSAGKESELDPREVRLLTLADIAMGNGDRHRNNMLLGTDRGGRLRVIPIDQNLAFSSPSITVSFFNTHFVPGFYGIEEPEGHPEYQHLGNSEYARRSGSLVWFRKRNNASRLVFRPREEDPALVEDVVAAVNFLVATLDDTYLERILGELPNDAFTRVPAKLRKPEIRRVFRLRRDGLRRAVLADLSMISNDAVQARESWRGKVPADLRRKLGLSEQDERLVIRQIDGGVEPTNLVTLYQVLLELGAEKLLARQVVLGLAEEIPAEVGVLGLKDLMLAEHSTDRVSLAIDVATFGDYRKTRARFGGLYRDMVPERPVGLRRCFQLVSTSGGRRLLDARGRRLSRPEADALTPWISALDEVVPPRPGDRVLLERDVFADVPGRKAYRVGVRNGDAYRFTGTLGFPVAGGGAD